LNDPSWSVCSNGHRGALAEAAKVTVEAANDRQDVAREVAAAITSPWSNGQTKGQVNKIKMLKRQMCGRASVDLPRQRLLAA
jgi:transposase